jgi:hypothetical protein
MIRVDLGSLRRDLQEMSENIQEAARPAAQAAAQVLYDEVRKNVSQIPRKTGNLMSSIYQAYSQANSGPGVATYHVSWNPRRAPHAYLVEHGHIQRYVTYMGRDGNFYTAIRPEMRGKPKPRRGASQAEKDAYYVPLPAPKQVPAVAYFRRAASAIPRAEQAAIAVLERALE